MVSTLPAGGSAGPLGGPGPVLPKSVPGAPPNPGGTPALSPGGGAGNKAAGMAVVKAAMPAMHKALSAFPVGSAEYKAVHKAISALIPIFGAAEDSSLVPAAIQQMASAAKQGGPLAGAPAPGLQPAPPPGGPPGGGAAMAA